MATTKTFIGRTKEGRRILRWVETSAADTLLAVSVPGGSGRRVVQVSASYSAAPTQAGVTTEIDSGAGAAYDATFNTGSANARYTNYQPTTPLVLGNDDALRVTAPAGGGVITSSIVVITEDL